VVRKSLPFRLWPHAGPWAIELWSTSHDLGEDYKSKGITWRWGEVICRSVAKLLERVWTAVNVSAVCVPIFRCKYNKAVNIASIYGRCRHLFGRLGLTDSSGVVDRITLFTEYGQQVGILLAAPVHSTTISAHYSPADSRSSEFSTFGTAVPFQWTKDSSAHHRLRGHTQWRGRYFHCLFSLAVGGGTVLV